MESGLKRSVGPFHPTPCGVDAIVGAVLMPVERRADLISTVHLIVFALVNLVPICGKRRAHDSSIRLPLGKPIGASVWSGE